MSAGISNDTIQDALQRAKELAAATAHGDSQKRPADGDLDAYPAKRLANGMDMSGNPIATLGGMPANMSMAGQGGNEIIVEQIEVPDHTVGLVIGRGGEQITQIQSQSGCRVQMSPECDVNQMRQCTLQGTKASIEKAKHLIFEVIQRAGNRPPPGGGRGGFDGGMGGGGGGGGGRGTTHEMQIPGPKCGLIIGKGGETIKNIQETAGVKMIMIQESQESGMNSKPLRIIGDPEKVEHAKRLVEEIINSRDDNPPSQRFNAYGSMMGGGGGGGGGGPRSIGEVIVPRSSVGMIIGKGGETIKRLANESGAKIQFKPDDDPTTPDRCAVIQGTAEQIAKATQMISDLVNKSGAGGGSEVFYMHVPSNKTGLVIGKGGETIKQICGESGAHVELSRDPPPNATEKIFIIKGTPYQIHHAQHIIRIKVGDIPPGTPVSAFHGPGGDYGAQQAQGYGQGQFSQGAWNNFGGGPQQQSDPNAAAWAQYYAQQQQQQYPGYQQQYQQPQPAGAPAQPQANPASSAPSINPQTGQPDYSAQWVEYYRSLGMHEQANIIEQQAKQNAANAQAGQPAAQAGRPQQPGFGGGYGTAQAAQNQFGYGAPQAQPAAGYQFPGTY